MGIKLFYILSIIYFICSAIGIFTKELDGSLPYVFLVLILIYYIFYFFKKRIELYHSVIAGISVNLVVQLTGNFDSPLFYLYFLAIPLIGFKDKYRNYWLIVLPVIFTQILSGVLVNKIQILLAVSLFFMILISGTIIKNMADRLTNFKRSLVRYEAKDQFLGPARFAPGEIRTSIKEIDRHTDIERPLLYFVKFVQNIFNAYTTAIFSHSDNNLVLVQGFSRSELFNPDTVIDLRSGIYSQIISERRSILIKEFAQNPQELGYYRGELRIASVMIAPIILVDDVEGIFIVDRISEQFTDEDKRIFDEATKTAGFLLAVLRLYEKERYEARYLSSIAELAGKLQMGLELDAILSNITKTVSSFMKCDDISIAAVDELNNVGEVLKSTYIKENKKFSLDEGLVGMIARHRHYILKEDLSEGNVVVLERGEERINNSFVGVPVEQDDELLGVIWGEDHQTKKFNEDDIKALSFVASQLSIAWQRANLHERVKELSIRDGLTGLYNHRHFQEVLEAEIKKEKELILLFIDIDHFKKINDTYGHQAGDEVLKFLGRLISKSGIAARYGGEEFTLILPKCSLKKGIDVAIRLKDHLLKSEIKFNRIKIGITVSIGIASYPADAKTRMELIDKADRALYRAKETGRNKIVISQQINEKLT